MILLLDPGHGGPYPGACSGGVRECDVNLDVAKLILRLSRSEGLHAYLTRDGDFALDENSVSRDLRARVSMADRLKPDLFLSLHCNAAASSSAHGLEVWTSPGQTRSDDYATRILTSLGQAFPDRRIRTDWADGDPDQESGFFVLARTKCPAVLVEMGFISNDEERTWLMGNKAHMAMAILAGVLKS